MSEDIKNAVSAQLGEKYGMYVGASVFTANDKGGVGKTTCKLIRTNVLVNLNVHFRLIDVDSRRNLTAYIENSQQLSGIEIMGLNGFTTQKDVKKVGDAARELESHYDAASEWWLSGTTETDVGAGRPDGLLQYERNSELPELYKDAGIRPFRETVASADQGSLESAYKLTTEWIRLYGTDADHIMTLNDRTGRGFEWFENGEAYPRLRKLEQDGVLEIIRIPFCDSLLVGENIAMSPFEALDRADEINEELKLGAAQFGREKRKLTKFLAEATEAFEPMCQRVAACSNGGA
ncbi:MAG: hypothetical protein VR70_10750 [Rhodospirillaceae bacterium BRH_c57]|nr:MAG: hypothetical protein VR70_10750 [Rhodospirillaceae bacterium BRH_c57]